ncbi:hypothetical protein [Commensalibacter oyaizuii]|uniref:Uncharacterized protein n=1 Tax=Commensalibacter oyaizuii TaxID=3043873 RepID=A0ABT6Q3B1_9PROT|nr:hypothetical protein [Commensalibacter sp. TBRC 16381]MDI2091603.1 hypothetical protein [Commensalibacter sp. TBRC 16381]
MHYITNQPHSIKIHPALVMGFDGGKSQPLSTTTQSVYTYLLDNAIFNDQGKKTSSIFITHQQLAEKLRFHLLVIKQSIDELTQAGLIQHHQDGYLVLIRKGDVS